MAQEIASILDLKYEILNDMDFTPTPTQKPIFDAFLEPYNRILITGGWRAGKSETSSGLLVLGYHLDIKKPIEPRLYWIIGKEYDTCRQEYEKSYKYFKKLDLVEEAHMPPEGQCMMKLRGMVKIETRSADDEWKIAEAAPNGVLLVEAGRLTESIWHRTIGRLVEKRGWCVLSGTLESSDPRAHPWYPNLFWEWQAQGEPGKSFSMPTWSNTVLFSGRYDPVITEAERQMTEDMFQEKFGAIPVKPSGLIMKEFSNEIHVGRFPYNPDAPVELAIDPGYGGAYAVVAIQIIESKPRLIGEVYLDGFVTEDVILKCQKEFLSYFDQIQGGVIDIAATQHQAMPAVIEVWQKMTHINLRCKKIEEEFGIEKLRTALKVDPVTKKPGLYVDVSCRGFIAECGGGQSPVPGGGAWLRDALGKTVNRNNHSTKAVIYWLVDRYGYAPYMKPYAKQQSLLKQVTTTGMYR